MLLSHRTASCGQHHLGQAAVSQAEAWIACTAMRMATRPNQQPGRVTATLQKISSGALTEQQETSISGAPGGQHACVGCRRDDAIQSAAEAFAAKKAELRELKAALDAQAKFLDNEQANNQEVSQRWV